MSFFRILSELLLFDLSRKFGRVAVLHRLQMLAIKNQFARNFENFVRDPHHSHRRIFRPLFQIGANRVESVAYEYWLDEPQLVVTVAKDVDVVVSHDAQIHTEGHRPSHQALSKPSFVSGELFIGYVGMHIENERVESHAFALRNGSANRAGAEAYFKILVEPHFLIPDLDLSVLGRARIWVCHVLSIFDRAQKHAYARAAAEPRRSAKDLLSHSINCASAI